MIVFFLLLVSIVISMGLLQKKCKSYGCGNLHHNVSGYCDECTAKWRAAHPEKRAETPADAARKHYGSGKWRKFSEDYLRFHPTCALCGAQAKVVDHKDMPADVMVDVYGGFDYDPSHYQALCYRCNAIKGAHEDKKVREAYRRDKAALETQGGVLKNEIASSNGLG